MKQMSLLDSFMKRQAKKQPNDNSQKQLKGTSSKQQTLTKSKQSSNKQCQQQNKSPSAFNNENKTTNAHDHGHVHNNSNNNNNKFRKSKRNIDSDQQECMAPKQISRSEHQEEMEMEEQFEELDISQQHDRNQNKKKNKGNNRGRSKSRGKKQGKSAIKPMQDNKNQQQNPLSQFTDATPAWAQRQHCKDKQMRSPTDPNYDPTTLHVPSQAWAKFTAPMKQFWRIKSQNFDKVVLFKLGKFYEMFYDDAAVGNKYLNLKYMGTKMHTGFPEKCLDKYAAELVQLGFKTVIVEQMQTPEQMNQRVKMDKNKGRKSQKTINRQVTQILTRGTYVPKQQEQTSYLPNYLLSLRVYGDVFGFSLLQMATNQLIMGSVDSLQKFKTLLFQTRPSQLIYDPDNVNFEVCQMMQKSFLHIQMTKVYNKNNLWHPLNSLGEIDRLEKQQKMRKSKIFQIINGFNQINKNLLYATLSGMFDYLKKVFRFQYVINSVRFSFYEKDVHSKNMILDSQALQHLEIFETSQGIQGSLFDVIDRTKTKFGKRMLRRWMMSPLMNQFHINQRLNAIQDLEAITVDRARICTILKNLPDLDKKINKLYHYAIKTTSASKAIYFEDVNTARLKQFKQVMQKMEYAWEAVSILGKKCKQFKSNRLKQLVILANQKDLLQNEEEIYAEDEDDQSVHNGLMPDIISHLTEFKAYVKWEGNVPIPQKGLVSYFDQLQNQVEKIKKQLQQYLQTLRYQINEANLKFVHTKQRYEIEIPEKAEKRKPKNFQFSSKRAGFSRYISPTSKQMVKNLQKVQQQLKQQMGIFIGFFFEQFKKKQKIWQRYVEILAQIDCLISLSQYSFLNSKVRPNFSEGRFQIKGAKHPCLLNIDFIPNDVSMKSKVMLLTGPNMGGKSTILRTVCCLAILAQIGCYIPAESYDCQPIDRIFTRIGASDKLQLGKSTFFIEMQETKSILEHGTSRSIAIIDQLGRGTSTFDGLAIAYSVLKYILQQIKCYCFFATHYHILIDEFRQNYHNQVKLMMMDSMLKQDQIVFLYKLVPGNVERSFGLNVAARVGISKNIIAEAEKQAEKMNSYIQGKRKGVLRNVLQFIKQDK